MKEHSTEPTANRGALDRVLVVGLGSIGARHARIARQLLPNAEIMVLRHQRCGDLAGTGIDHCVVSMTEALRFRPQAAVIANPAAHHLAAAIPLAEAGVHLLVEKPLAATAEGVRELIDLCRRRGTVLMAGYNLRFLPALREFRRLVREGAAGRILSIRAEAGQYLPTWRKDADYRTGVSARASLGGGVLLELSHEIDYLQWCFGNVSWVSATLARASDLEIDVEDVAHLALGFQPLDGGKEQVAAVSLDFIRHDTTRSCIAIGDRGTLRWNASAGSVELFEAGATGWRQLFARPQERDDSYRAEWQDFIECTTTGGTASVTGDDALATLRVVDAARRSSHSRSVVTLAPSHAAHAVTLMEAR